jgi:hypothetical protein
MGVRHSLWGSWYVVRQLMGAVVCGETQLMGAMVCGETAYGVHGMQ